MRNMDKTPREGTKRYAAVMTARKNLGHTPQEIVRKIAATPEFGGNVDEAKEFYKWMREPSDAPTKRDNPYIDPALYSKLETDNRRHAAKERGHQQNIASDQMSAAQAYKILGIKRAPSFEVKLPQKLEEVLLPAYGPCPEFTRTCGREMRWNPSQGHVPRGPLGACGDISEVELVLVFAEPGDPHAEELDPEHTALLQRGGQTALNRVYEYATWAVQNTHDLFHENLRRILDMCWPDASFEQQLRKVWLTDSVLCSAREEAGRVIDQISLVCGRRYLRRQVNLFKNNRPFENDNASLIVAVGGKARDRLRSLGFGASDFISVYSVAPPFAQTNYAEALASWERIPAELNRRRGNSP